MQNYASRTLAKIDERFYLDSVVKDIINNGIELDFSGVKTVTIYNFDTVPENDYVRSGYHRFGELIELGNGVQEFTMTQDKSFTFSIDRGNREDTMMLPVINHAIRRQVREVSIPTTDKYILSTAFAYAVGKAQGPANATLTANTVFEAILAQKSALEELSIPVENLVIYMTPAIRDLLFVSPTYKIASNGAFQDNKTGDLNPVVGMKINVVPSSYLPANANFFITAKNVIVAPKKFDMVRSHDNVVGIDGSVAEGRRYYDAFIPTQAGKAMRYHKSA